MNLHLCALLLCAALPAAYAADRCETKSTANVPLVVELYTSEGCNSCPPADRWLSGLKGRNDVVALAFHVDYWDRLGWVDRFADAAYTRRQAEQQRLSGGGFVYTPQVLVDGRDWRRWPTLPEASRASVVELQLAREGDRVRAQVTPLPGAPKQLAAYWVATEDGHVSQVKAGENAGVSLRHDAVVRNYQPVSAFSGARELSFASPAVGEGQRPRRVALVVTDARGMPLQAVALSCGGG
ncbi:MAG TPA: DUF1223 domain-containing protein [Burkholderiaceae bacterium]|nr:DUF1223 domain-containing protein [Burkholderiaceae bacterium]